MSLYQRKIRVMVVDDSAVVRNVLISGLSAQPNIEVVGYAINALDAQTKLFQLKPDVLTLDVEMPGMSGIDFLKQFAASIPPVILVSSLNLRVFEALAAGAMDFVRKPDGTQSKEDFIRSLAQKIIVAAYTQSKRPAVNAPLTSSPTAPAKSVKATVAPPLGPGLLFDQTIIGIGASTGGTEATLKVLETLPADSPAILIVQHMPPGFTAMYAERLDRLCAMEVREAKHGDEVRRGLALLAPADYQMRVVKSGGRYTVSCQQGEKISGHRPSVDALFFSMAQTFRVPMVGIIMTGMGRDGANGLLAMRKAGAYTIGQDEASCVVYGMPMAAQQIGAVKIQASCENIAGLLLRHLKNP